MNAQVRHIIPISGKDSFATAIIQMKLEPDIDYEFMFNPTGSELPPVFDWIRDVGEYLGKEVVMVGNNLENIIVKNGFFLPSPRKRYCTKQSKIIPMVDYIGNDDAEVYFGIRWDEPNRKGFNNMWSPNISCNYPLRDHKINIDRVYEIINESNIPPPVFFWNRLYEDIKKTIGFDPCEVLSPWEKDHIFTWRTRANCYHCFYQRSYEVVGLWEHYPELAEKALWYESQGTSKANFTWMKKPFDWYMLNADAIYRRRFNKVLKLIGKKLEGKLMKINEDDTDMVMIGTCGLLCGK